MRISSPVIAWLVGCVVGFILGYIVRSLREINEKVDKVDDHVTHMNGEHRNNDEGRISRRLVENIALVVALALTVWASISSQNSSNAVKDQQDKNTLVATCTQTYLAETIVALNTRTQYTLAQNSAVYDLNKAQGTFLGTLVLKKPPVPPATAFNALQVYFAALTNYLTVAATSNKAISDHPYPTSAEYTDCLKDIKQKGKKPK